MQLDLRLQLIDQARPQPKPTGEIARKVAFALSSRRFLLGPAYHAVSSKGSTRNRRLPHIFLARLARRQRSPSPYLY